MADDKNKSILDKILLEYSSMYCYPKHQVNLMDLIYTDCSLKSLIRQRSTESEVLHSYSQFHYRISRKSMNYEQK